MKQEKQKLLLKFSMNRSRNDYRNLKPKKRSKSGWIETHHQKELLRKSYASVVVIGDSIVAGLRLINLRIGGARLENVAWRINDTLLSKSVRSVVIRCGTYNIDTSSSDEISLGVVAIAKSISHRYSNIKVSGREE